MAIDNEKRKLKKVNNNNNNIKKNLQVTFYDPQVAWTLLGHYTKSTRLLQPR
jgi:hypothetical protein